MQETITFQIQFDENVKEITKQISSLGFEKKDDSFVDSHNRKIVIKDSSLELTLQKTDLIDEQEQLEYILGNLGLDADNAKAI
jgi:hypothetical protein